MYNGRLADRSPINKKNWDLRFWVLWNHKSNNCRKNSKTIPSNKNFFRKLILILKFDFHLLHFKWAWVRILLLIKIYFGCNFAFFNSGVFHQHKSRRHQLWLQLVVRADRMNFILWKLNFRSKSFLSSSIVLNWAPYLTSDQNLM